MLMDLLRLLLFPALMAFAASSDLFTMTISNRLPLTLAGAFVLLAPAIGMSIPEFGMHVGAAALVLAVAFGFFAMGWIGGGDAKLVAATALWFGFTHLLEYLVYGALLGGALTLLILVFRSRILPPFMAMQPWIDRLHDKGAGVPYGIALAAAALLVYPHTPWMPAAGL